jgi:hypothetical protein
MLSASRIARPMPEGAMSVERRISDGTTAFSSREKFSAFDHFQHFLR